MKLKSLLMAVCACFSLSVLAFAQTETPTAPATLPKPPKLKKEKGFKVLFDGKTFKGWKMAEENHV